MGDEDKQFDATPQKLERARKEGQVVSVSSMKKNRRFQKEQLTAQGYSDIEDVF